MLGRDGATACAGPKVERGAGRGVRKKEGARYGPVAAAGPRWRAGG